MNFKLVYYKPKSGSLASLVALSCISLLSFTSSCSSEPPVSSLQQGKSNEWQSLFNGKDLDDWIVKIHHHEVGDNYAQTFRVKDDKIQVSYDGYGDFDNRYGHLFYKEPFSSYHLSLEYRFTDEWLEDAPDYTYRNSGIMFHSQAPSTILKEQDWPVSVEFQLLAGEDNGKPRPTGNMCSPGTDVVYQGKIDPRHCIDSSSKTFKWDQWVKADLIVYKDSLVTHLINGDTVLQYSLPQIGGGIANNYDQQVIQQGQLLKEGYIALQSEGQGIEFRDVKIKKLDTLKKK
ncbi:3-keto-disaccharide hydrolase [Pontibacter sp. CAU 1760]